MSYKESLDYRECTDKEKIFVDTYLDATSPHYLNIEGATILAFGIKETAALAYGRGILGRERIKRIVAAELETPLPTREEFLRVLWKNANASGKSVDGKTILGALQLFADVSGWRVRTAARPKSAEDSDKPNPLKDLLYPASNETDSSSEEEDSE